MNTVLGLLGVALFIVLVIGLAAGITWAVVRISPTDKDDPNKQPRPSS